MVSTSPSASISLASSSEARMVSAVSFAVDVASAVGMGALLVPSANTVKSENARRSIPLSVSTPSLPETVVLLAPTVMVWEAYVPAY